MNPVGKDIVLQNKSKDKKFQIGHKAITKKNKSKTKQATERTSIDQDITLVAASPTAFIP